MYPDPHALLRISSVLKNIDGGALLMDEQGRVIFPEGDARRLTIPESVRGKPFAPVVYGGVTLAGISADPNREGCAMYVCLTGSGVDVRNCAMLCAELIANILQSGNSTFDKSAELKRLLRGECNVSEMERLAKEFGLPIAQNRCVMCVYLRSGIYENLGNELRAFACESGDAAVEFAGNMWAVIKAVSEEAGFDGIAEAALNLRNALQAAEIDAVIGVSDPKTHIGELAAAMQEARDAVNVGGVYRQNENLLIHRRLMLERFVYSIPASNAAEHSAKVFNTTSAKLFTEEMIHTIEVFFASNLNLSEAARTLGIHRNTLVYRIEKVQKLTGLDLREFDDAVTFKLLMLLNRNSNAVKPLI